MEKTRLNYLGKLVRFIRNMLPSRMPQWINYMVVDTLLFVLMFAYFTTLIMASVSSKKKKEAHNYFRNKGKPRKIYHLINIGLTNSYLMF